jgi:xanthine dehydrogenase accessory factor
VSLQSEFAGIAKGGGRAALVTVVRAESSDAATSGDGSSSGGAVRPGARLLVRADGERRGTLGDPDLDRRGLAHAEELIWAERSELREEGEGVTLFVDVVAPPPRLIVFGAVDFAAALCRMARAAGWRPFLVDPRSRFATPERFPDAEEIVVGWPKEAFQRIGGIDRATYIAVLTHDPKLDDAALAIALESDARYIGAMGSRRAQAKRRERLLEAGVPDERLVRIAAPIGLDLGGLTAEETALSIMAEVVAVRNGREGGRLSSASGRIHEVGA